MIHLEKFIDGPRAHRLYTQSWMPEQQKNPKAIIIVAHGLAEHSSRYMNVVNYFLPLGYGVAAIDHLGHGKSEGERCYVKSMDDLVEPLNTYVESLKTEFPSTPLILLGHSMGGLIATLYLAQYQHNITAVILSSPAVFGAQQPTAWQQFTVLLKSLFSPKSGYIQLDSRGVSRDPAVVKAYEDDPLVFSGKMTVGLAIVMGKAMGSLKSQASKITLPVLIVQGGKDLLVNPKGAEALLSWISSNDKELTMYPESYHEVLNEPEHEKLLQELQSKIESWI